jgi:Viral BACON domain
VNRLGTESTAFAATPVETQDACTAAKLVLASAGVRPLDTMDQQLLSSIAMPACPGAPSLVATPASLRFLVAERGAKLPEQTVHVSAEGADAVAWTATISTGSGGHWLAATPVSGNTPGQIVIEANPANLAPGTYPATVSIAAQGSATPLSIPVELVVAVPPGEGAPTRPP